MEIITPTLYRQSPTLPITFLVMKREDINALMGLNLKRLRLKAGLTQEVLSEMINVSQGLIPRWELGRTGIGKDVLLKFCAALNVQPYEFYLDENTPIPMTDLEKKALYMARAAANARLGYIAEEIVEYGNQRIEQVKKQTKAGADKGRTARLKAG